MTITTLTQQHVHYGYEPLAIETPLSPEGLDSEYSVTR